MRVRGILLAIVLAAAEASAQFESGAVLTGRSFLHLQAASLASMGWIARNPTLIRFHPLIATMSEVRATCSSGVNCACMARDTSSGARVSATSVRASVHASAARSRSL